MPEVLYQIRKLEALAPKCGVGEAKKAQEAVDMSKMTPYEQQQYKMAASMQTVRQNILELDNLGEKASATRKSELANAIRKDLRTMRKDAVDAKKLAQNEDKKSDYEKLISHMKKTEELYNSRFSAGDDEAKALAAGANGGRGVTELDTEMTALSHPMVSLRDDEEFQLFFEQTQKNDQLMDQALDRLSVGVQQLHQNAKTINEELKVQKELLEQTEVKVTHVTAELITLNKKLKKTIKEVEKDKICIYVICFLLLLGLGGAIYWQISSSKKEE